MIFKPAKRPKFFYLSCECLHRGDFEKVENSLVDNFRADEVRQSAVRLLSVSTI
jgi:hypothetical protein